MFSNYPQVVLGLAVPAWLYATVGTGSHLWAYTTTAAYLIHAALQLCTRRIPFSPGRRQAVNTAAAALVASPFAAVGYGVFIGRSDYRVREVDVSFAGLPAGLEGIRLLQVSDIHLSAFLSEKEFAGIIDLANETRPHVALVTGDLISFRGDPLDGCLRQLARLRSDAGTWGCLGNHEQYAAVEDYTTRAGARLGIRFLRRESEALRFGSATLNLAGVDYQRIRLRPAYLNGAEKLVLPGATNILLSHNPDVFPVAARKGFQLTVSGHTHGGQVNVEILDQGINPARFLTPYTYGLYRSGGAAAYVTRGVGTIGIPARIGAPPEIAVLRLKRV